MSTQINMPQYTQGSYEVHTGFEEWRKVLESNQRTGFPMTA